MVFSHRIKKTVFMNRPVNIVLQNENGPCPLLSIANVLILQGSLKIHPDRSEITSDQLVEMIGTHLIDKNPPLKDEALQQNQQQTLNDIMGILPTMENGLDVNVKFDKVSSFEYDVRISVFDMLGVSLFHGWVADPNDPETFQVVGSLSYNQLVDRIVMADTKTMHREKKRAKDEDKQETEAEQVTASGSGAGREDGEKEEATGAGGGANETETETETVEKLVETKKSASGGEEEEEEEEEDDEAALEMLRQEVEELSETQSNEKKATSGGGGEEEEEEEEEEEDDDDEEETNEEELAKELKQAREEAGEREEEKQELELEQAIAAKKEDEEQKEDEEEEDEEVAELKKEADVARRFLQDTASQLTYLGLTELHNSVDERKLCVFFRNNHFSTMFRMNGDLYLLLTDQGYEKQHTVAWEKLDEINGDTEIVSPEFGEPETYTNFREDLITVNSSDRQLALQLQEEENQRAAPAPPRNPQGMSESQAFVEQQRRMLQAYNQRQQRGASPRRGRGRSQRGGDDQAKKSGCVLS